MALHAGIMFSLFFLLLILTSKAARPLTPYQRSFTPLRNISCAQCAMEVDTNEKPGQTYVQIDMNRRQCLDDPEKFFKPCPTNGEIEPRGCAKLVTYSEMRASKDTTYKMTLVRRFCASEGAEPEEQQCRFSPTMDGYSMICICGDDNCNHAPGLKTTLISVPIVLSALWFVTL